VLSLAPAAAPRPAQAAGVIEDLPGRKALPDFDVRAGKSVTPTSTQQALATQLRSAMATGNPDQGLELRWNNFGAPKSVINLGGNGLLATGLRAARPEEAARAWLTKNATLFRQTPASVAALELVRATQLQDTKDRKLVGTDNYVVLFRQKFGGLIATYDGMVTVSVKGSATGGWAVVHSSSSLTGSTALAAPARISAKSAWLAAAANTGKKVAAEDVQPAPAAEAVRGWQSYAVEGFAQPQRTRLAALPTPDRGVRPVYENIILNSQNGNAEAYTVFVDAATGEVLRRQNLVTHFADLGPLAAPVTQNFSGEFGETTCGPNHDFVVGTGIAVIYVNAAATISANDIVLKLFYNGTQVAEADTLTSPESLRYFGPNGNGVPAGTYTVQVCPYTADTVAAPYTYTGTFTTDTTAAGAQSKWRYFTANPPLTYETRDTRILGCWGTIEKGDPVPPGCDREEANTAARQNWDTVGPILDNNSTFTTVGNAAFTGENWQNYIVPQGAQYRPQSQERNYDFAWTNQWYERKCDPQVFAVPPGGQINGGQNDIAAATTNLFAAHNRIHDWSYYLGFTETTYNAQFSNFGTTAPGAYPQGFERDPEQGDVQAGAVAFGYPSFAGRDNANQITLPDGQAPITNMYLWQPITGSFYAPCVDGDYDMAIIAHEYGHLIQNRMVAGPDAQLSGHQARAMGESWSDLTAIEYLNEYGYVPTDNENPFTVGAYATGNPITGIRNYAMNVNPDLNYSSLEYDPNGVGSPHADGEIWSATNFDIRQLLINKYNATYRYDNKQLQGRCAEGEFPAGFCPGNRRWFQILMDAFLLMPSEVTMVDARDAYLAADRMRFNGANQKELWLAFARRGLGRYAASPATAELSSPRALDTRAVENRNPAPNFISPQHGFATLRFGTYTGEPTPSLVESGDFVPARIYVGKYEARIVPVADTYAGTSLRNEARFAPGTYNFLVVAPGYGHYRFTRTVREGETTTLRVTLPTNYASVYKGGRATGNGVQQAQLIDDTEGTNWAVLNAPNVKYQNVTVDLAGGRQLVKRIQVSALLRPNSDPNSIGADTDPQARVSALRQFGVLHCTASAANANCTNGGWRNLYVSAPDAFPAGRPRPIAPNLAMKTFDVPDVYATHLRFYALTTQCTGAPDYQGEQDNDPRYATDCDDGQDDAALPSQGGNVRAAEFQVFGTDGSVVATTTTR
jgi:hypothetical protein